MRRWLCDETTKVVYVLLSAIRMKHLIAKVSLVFSDTCGCYALRARYIRPIQARVEMSRGRWPGELLEGYNYCLVSLNVVEVNGVIEAAGREDSSSRTCGQEGEIDENDGRL